MSITAKRWGKLQALSPVLRVTGEGVEQPPGSTFFLSEENHLSRAKRMKNEDKRRMRKRRTCGGRGSKIY